MAIDKAVDSAVLDAGLTQIADAIRAKGGTSAALSFPRGMADAVAAIETGGTVLPELTNPAAASDIYTGTEAIDGSGAKLTGTNPYRASNVDPAVTDALTAIAEKGVDTSGAGLTDLATLIASIEAGGGGVIFEQIVYIPAETITVAEGSRLEIGSTTVTTPHVLMFARMNGSSQYASDYVASVLYEIAMTAGFEYIGNLPSVNMADPGVVSNVYHSSSSSFFSKSVRDYYESNVGAFNRANSSNQTMGIENGKLFFVAGARRAILSAGATFVATVVGV